MIGGYFEKVCNCGHCAGKYASSQGCESELSVVVIDELGTTEISKDDMRKKEIELHNMRMKMPKRRRKPC